MLNALRTGAGSGFFKFIFFGLLCMATLGLVMMDMGGFFRGSFGKQVMARMDGAEISIIEFDNTYRKTLRQQNIDGETAAKIGLPRMILNQEINRQLLYLEANNYGMNVSNEVVANMIRERLEEVPYGANDQEKLQILLRNAGLSEAGLVQAVKADLAIDSVLNALPIYNSVPEAVLRKIYAYNNEERIAEVVTIDESEVSRSIAVDETEIQTFYDNAPNSFKLPETRSIKILTLSPKEIRESVTISDEEVKSYYDINGQEFEKPGEVLIDQIIVSDQAAAEQIYSQLISGEISDINSLSDQAQVQDDFSIDPGALPEDLSAAIETANPGEWISAPIKTSLGWHIVYLNERISPQKEPFENVSKEIKEFLTERAVDDRLYTIAEEMDAMAVESENLEEIAHAYDTNVETIEGMPRMEAPAKGAEVLKSLGEESEADVRAHAYTLYEGEISPLIETDDGGYALIQVSEIKESVRKPYDSVKEEIKNRIEAQKKRTLVRDLASQVMSVYEESNSLLEVAKKLDLPFERTRKIGRSEGSSTIDAAVKQQLFKMEKIGEIAMIPQSNVISVVRLSDVIPEENWPGIDSDEIKSLSDSLAETQSTEIQQQYIMNLYDKYNTEVNQTLLFNNYVSEESQLY